MWLIGCGIYRNLLLPTCVFCWVESAVSVTASTISALKLKTKDTKSGELLYPPHAVTAVSALTQKHGRCCVIHLRNDHGSCGKRTTRVGSDHVLFYPVCVSLTPGTKLLGKREPGAAPLPVTDILLENLGKVDTRFGFHSSKTIFPPGARSRKNNDGSLRICARRGSFLFCDLFIYFCCLDFCVIPFDLVAFLWCRHFVLCVNVRRLGFGSQAFLKQAYLHRNCIPTR